MAEKQVRAASRFCCQRGESCQVPHTPVPLLAEGQQMLLSGLLTGHTGGKAGGREQSWVQSKSSKGDLRNKRLRITIEARDARGTVSSDHGSTEPSGTLLSWPGGVAPDFRPRGKLQGKDRVLGFSLKSDTGWVGEKFCFGVS